MRKIAFLFVFISLSSYAQETHITIDAARVLNKIPATLYGSCIEDVNHEVYGGLYDQRLFGESFEEPAPHAGFRVSACWDGVEVNAAGTFAVDTLDVFTGRQSQAMALGTGRGRIGIANSGLNHWGISVRQGQRLDGSVFLHGDLRRPVTVALESADGRKTYAVSQLTGIASSWKKHPFSLTPNATDPHARFVLYIQDGKLWVDQATLMSSGAAQFKGLPLRADIATMMVKEGLRFLRYGGTMVNAPAYRWKNMTGSRDTRPPYKGHWYPYSSNGFGIEDFVRFCEAAGFEPAFAINVEETPEDVADMVAYLTGDASTAGGRRRAAAGHPAPYKLHYIEIGNEEVIWGDKLEDYEHYCERFNILYNAIHAKNPSIQLVCAAWWRPASAHMEKVFRAINGKAARWDLHTDADDPAAGRTVDRTLQRMQELFMQWDPNTTLKCAVFEENGGLHDLQRALGHATTLNAIRRHGDFVLTSCPANALQPYRENDNDWDQGQLFFTSSQVWGMPPFYAQQMASANHQPLRVADHTEGDLDVTATRSEDSSVLVIHAVNTTDKAVKATIELNNFSSRRPDVEVYTLQGELKDENTPEDPEKIRTVKTIVRLPGDHLSYVCPAHSYLIFRLSK